MYAYEQTFTASSTGAAQLRCVAPADLRAAPPAQAKPSFSKLYRSTIFRTSWNTYSGRRVRACTSACAKR